MCCYHINHYELLTSAIHIIKACKMCYQELAQQIYYTQSHIYFNTIATFSLLMQVAK